MDTDVSSVNQVYRAHLTKKRQEVILGHLILGNTTAVALQSAINSNGDTHKRFR